MLISQNNEINPHNLAYDMPEYQQAKEYLDTRKYAEAEALIVIVLAKLKEKGNTADYGEIQFLHAKSLMHQWRSDEALEIYKEVKKEAKEANLNHLYSDAIQALCIMYQFKENYEQIESLVSEGLQIEGLPPADYSNYYLIMGEVWWRKNNLDSALYHSNIAYEIDKEINDSISLPKTCQVISLILVDNNDHDEALKYLIEGKSYISGENNYKHSYFNADIARIMLSVRNIEKAKSYAKESVRYARLNKLVSTLSDHLSLLASIEEMEGNYEIALSLYNEALELNKKTKKIEPQIRINSGTIACKLNLGKKVKQKEINDLLDLKSKTKNEISKDRIDQIYLRYMIESDISESEYYAASNELIEGFKSRNNLYDLRDIYKLNHEFYTRNGNYKEAIDALQSYMQYRDTIFAEQQEFKILELEATYDKIQDEKIIDQLGVTNKAQALTLKQQTAFLITTGGGFLIISVLSFFLYKYYKKVKRQNEIVSSALKEKDFLLREIHHRVKNNLQVISSLLSLQARQIEDEDIQKAIHEGRNRVRSMALIHQNLYQNENLTGVSVSSYLSKLLEELFDTYNVDADRIKLNLDIEDIDLDVDTMVPFGLILNELVSNCLKHAFPGDRDGLITIRLKDIENQLHLSIIDNGVGYTDVNESSNKSFGKRLIKAFSNKLNADMEVINNNGTKVKLTIKNFKKAS